MRIYKPKRKIINCNCEPKCISKCLKKNVKTNPQKAEETPTETPTETPAETPAETAETIVSQRDKYVTLDVVNTDKINIIIENSKIVNEAVKNAQVITDLLPTVQEVATKMRKFQNTNQNGKIVMNAPLDMKNQNISNLKNPENDTDAVNKIYLLTLLDRQIDAKQKSILNVPIPENDFDAANKKYVDSVKRNTYLYSQPTIDGLASKYFSPCIILETCTLQSLQWNILGSLEGKLFINIKPLNGAYEKTEICKKIRSENSYYIQLNISINDKSFIFLSTDFATTDSNVILCVES